MFICFQPHCTSSFTSLLQSLATTNCTYRGTGSSSLPFLFVPSKHGTIVNVATMLLLSWSCCLPCFCCPLSSWYSLCFLVTIVFMPCMRTCLWCLCRCFPPHLSSCLWCLCHCFSRSPSLPSLLLLRCPWWTRSPSLPLLFLITFIALVGHDHLHRSC